MFFRWLTYRFISLYDGLISRKCDEQLISQKIKKILLIELTRIGDVLMATPAIRNIRKRYPKAQIDMMVQQKCADMIIHNPNLSSVIGVKNIKNYLKLLCLTIKIKKEKYDLIVSFSPGIRNAFLAQFGRSRYRSGYLNNKTKIPTFFNDHFIETRGFISGGKLIYRKEEHLSTRAAKAILPLGIKIDDYQPELFYPSEKQTFADEPLKSANIKPSDFLIVIHPSSGWFCKSWPKKKYAQLIDRIIDCYKTQVIVIGSIQDSELLKFITSHTRNKPIVIEGCPLIKVAMIIKHANLFIGNDSGPLHIAGVFEIPFIALFGPSRPETVGPLSGGTFIRKEVVCSPCRQIKCSRSLKKEKTCMDLIEVDEVFSAVAGKIKEIREVSIGV